MMEESITSYTMKMKIRKLYKNACTFDKNIVHLRHILKKE